MKKIIFIFIAVFTFSCIDKKSLLESADIPNATEILDDPEDLDFNYARVELDNVISADSKVFGGFRKRFKFKGSWYVLADYMYNYTPSSKSLTVEARNIILKIDDEKKINVYAKNIPFDKYGVDNVETNWHDNHIDNAWFNLNKDNLVITENEIFHEDYWYDYHKFYFDYATNESSIKYRVVSSYQQEGEHGTTTHYTTNTYVKNYAYIYPTRLLLYSTSRGKTYTKDLINWQTQNSYDKVIESILFPFDGSSNITPIATMSFKNSHYIFYRSYSYSSSGNGLSSNVQYMYSRVNNNSKKWESIDLGKKNILKGSDDIKSVRFDDDKIYAEPQQAAYTQLPTVITGVKTEAILRAQIQIT